MQKNLWRAFDYGKKRKKTSTHVQMTDGKHVINL